MNYFTQETTGYEQLPAYGAFLGFMNSYLMERDWKKTCAFAEEDFFGLGFDGEKMIVGRDAFGKLLRAELEVLPEPIEYTVTKIYGKEIAEQVWEILAELDLTILKRTNETITGNVRFIGCFRLTEAKMSVLSAHLSGTDRSRKQLESLPYDRSKDARLTEILIQEARYDALTGVFNRGCGVQAIRRAMEKKTPYALAFFDIDNLKQLNDCYNHTVGDHALRFFAELLQRCFMEKAVLVRFGGDEFLAFCEGTQSQEEMEALFRALEEEYGSFIEVNYPKSQSSISIGCVIGRKKESFETLCQLADELMYEVKRSGKNGYKVRELK